jgi:signal transduction histidine kinase
MSRHGCGRITALRMNMNAAGPNILLIDDERLAAEFVKHLLLSETDISIVHEPESETCIEAACRVRPTVILVDLRMPTIDGLEVIRRLRAEPEWQQVPIMLLSSEESPEVKAQAFAAGANDYLVKWPDKRELIARLRYHSNAYLARRERDEAFDSLRQSQAELLARTRELEQSRAALHHAQKMEALGQLTGGVAHNFNNFLQIISSNLELMRLMIGNGNPQFDARIEAASIGVERAAKLAAHLMAFARRQPLQSTVIDVQRVMHLMAELLKYALGDLIVLQMQIDEGLWNVTVDPGQLENAILNLAINARDAMNGRGNIDIRLRNMPAAALADHPAAAGRDHVLIEIRDNGCGMPAEVLERVFDPFFTTKPLGQGTGLGLSMAYGFVKQSEGFMDMDSTEGIGTTVRIFLPRTKSDARHEPVKPVVPVRGNNETILVVEDESEVRISTVALLKGLGYRILQAEGPESALALLEKESKVDLLFTDVLMPGELNAVTFVERVRGKHPALKVLMTSGFFEDNLTEMTRMAETHQLLRKPYTAEALSQAISQMLLPAGAAPA